MTFKVHIMTYQVKDEKNKYDEKVEMMTFSHNYDALSQIHIKKS